MVALPASNACFHCLRSRGEGDSRMRGTTQADAEKDSPAAAAVVVRPIVCASRMGMIWDSDMLMS